MTNPSPAPSLGEVVTKANPLDYAKEVLSRNPAIVNTLRENIVGKPDYDHSDYSVREAWLLFAALEANEKRWKDALAKVAELKTAALDIYIGHPAFLIEPTPELVKNLRQQIWELIYTDDKPLIDTVCRGKDTP